MNMNNNPFINILNKEKISSNDVIEFNNVDHLIKNLSIMKFTKEDVLIIIKAYSYGEKITFNEYKYYKKINLIISNLSNYNKNYNLQFDVINRKIFNKVFKIKAVPNNITVSLNINFHPEINIKNKNSKNAYLYTINEYLKEEKILDNIIKPLKNKNFSTLEKFIYIYNTVKNFKPYKECDDNPYESRTLKYILKCLDSNCHTFL